MPNFSWMLSTQPSYDVTIEPSTDAVPALPPELEPTVPVNGHAVSVTWLPLMAVVDVEAFDEEPLEHAAIGTNSATAAAVAMSVRRIFTGLLGNRSVPKVEQTAPAQTNHQPSIGGEGL